MASQVQKLHFILLPLMAPGHMIPMIDIAKLLAQRGVVVSVVTTPFNANRFSTIIDQATEDGLQIQLLKLQFPSVEAGLPEGCENLDTLPSLNLSANFFVAINMLQQKVENLFEELNPRPNCIVSDMGLPWTTKIAQKFNIPRFVFHGTCCFSLLCSHNIVASNVLENIKSDSERFLVPGVPDRIELTKAQVSGATNTNSAVLKDVRDQIRAAEKTSYGVIVNSFDELELPYMKEYRKVKGENVWCIGPVSLCNTNNTDMANRGNKSSISEENCLKWLDSHKANSVVYASLGSLARLNTSQMIEFALGLEASFRPFIWAFGGHSKIEELEKWISENGFEERIENRGLLIRGWAPQVLILNHTAIGGFLTHCGWNSTLEGISAGVPLATWPMFADQFCNEKLVVQVLETGVSLGVEMPVKWGEEEKVGVLINKDGIKKALERLMGEDEEGQERRRKAKELAEMAKKAVEEGGSSHAHMNLLIQDVLKW